jgi:hypothetical protein
LTFLIETRGCGGEDAPVSHENCIAYFSHEGNQMMLAHAKYLDIAGQNHLTVVYIKNGVLGDIPCTLVVAFVKKSIALAYCLGF